MQARLGQMVCGAPDAALNLASRGGVAGPRQLGAGGRLRPC